MALLSYKKTFTDGNLKGITVPVEVSYPRSIARRRYQEAFEAQLSGREIRECAGSGTFVVSDVELSGVSL